MEGKLKSHLLILFKKTNYQFPSFLSAGHAKHPFQSSVPRCISVPMMKLTILFSLLLKNTSELLLRRLFEHADSSSNLTFVFKAQTSVSICEKFYQCLLASQLFNHVLWDAMLLSGPSPMKQLNTCLFFSIIFYFRRTTAIRKFFHGWLVDLMRTNK